MMVDPFFFFVLEKLKKYFPKHWKYLVLNSRYILQKKAVLDMSFVQKFSTGLVVNQIAWLAREKHKV